jgi:rod shape-determining protein MreD
VIPASEPLAARRAFAAVVLAAALFAAVVVQLTVVNRLPLPGAAEPDLVLELVTAIAVATGPMTGALAGFAGGLAVDLAPPVSHYAGEYALIFCLAGYAAARAVRAIWDTTGERDPITSFTVMAVAVAAGEAGKAALGLLLSDPDVTGPVISRVLPGAILYDLLLAPFAFLLVSRITRGAAAERAPAPEFSRAQRLASVFRQASAGAAPNLRLTGTGGSYQNPSAARRVPKLRLSGASSPSIARTIPAFTRGASFPLAGGRTPKLNFAGNPPARSARRVVRTPGRNWLRTATPLSVRGLSVRGSSLRGSSFVGSSALAGSSAGLAAKRASRTPARGWLRSVATSGRGSAAGLTGLAGPRPAASALAARSAPSGLSALSGAGTPLARRRSPNTGWLRTARSAGPSWAGPSWAGPSWAGPSWGAAGRRRSPRRGWLGSTSRSNRASRSNGASWRRGTGRGNWYSSSPSRAWLRRSHHPWRKRSYLPGGRPPVPPGARPMARTAIVSGARKPRLFGLLGGRW